MLGTINDKQLSLGDYNIQFDPTNVDEKYKPYVEYRNMKTTLYYNDFNSIDIKELVHLDKIIELEGKSQIAIMLQVQSLSYYLINSDEDKNGLPKSKYLYEFFEKLYGFSKTFVKSCLRVYKVFWRDYYHALYLDFNYSQLVEMLPLSKADMQCITADWSVRRIRAYKNELKEKLKVAESSPTKKSKGDDCELEEELEDDIATIGVSASYVIDVLVKSGAAVLNDCKYAPGTTSYKIYERALKSVIEAFRGSVEIDNTFIKE